MDGTVAICPWLSLDFERPMKVSSRLSVNSSPSTGSSGFTKSKQRAKSSKISVCVPSTCGTDSSDFNMWLKSRIVATSSETVASDERRNAPSTESDTPFLNMSKLQSLEVSLNLRRQSKPYPRTSILLFAFRILARVATPPSSTKTF